jgi:parallel beta-helix repeat protein
LNGVDRTKKLLVVGIITLLIGAGAVSGFNIQIKDSEKSVRGNTLYVGGSGPGNYSIIQDAINDAVDGDTVLVFDDSSPYDEWDIVIDKSINLIGEDKNTTVIDGNNNGIVIKIIRCSNVNINGFTIKDGGYKYLEDIIILIDNCNNCIISNNYLDNSEHLPGIYPTDGVHLIESNNIQITNNIIYDGRSIELRKSNDNIIAHNKLLDGKIVLGDSSNNNISYNVLSDGYGITFSYSDYNNLHHNNIININGTGFDIWRSSNCEIYMNNFENCRFSGISIDESRDNVFHYNNIKRNKFGICLVQYEGNFYSNNFIKNFKDVFTQDVGEYFFNGNYWNKPMFRPKIIIGLRTVWLRPPYTWGPHDYGWSITVPKILFDMNPALEPYDIKVPQYFDINDYIGRSDNL